MSLLALLLLANRKGTSINVSEPDQNEAFDQWCFTAPSDVKFDDGKPLPLLTVFLHRVCGNDVKKFEQGVDILRAAFEAGESAGRKS